MMQLGYNTNGLANEMLVDAIELVASTGYEAVAITIDEHALNPYVDGFEEELARVMSVLSKTGLVPVVETGARHLLDPRVKLE